MKRFLRILGFVIGAIVLVTSAFALLISFRGIPRYTPETIHLKVEVTPERVANGEKLASMLCRDCHYDQSTGRFTGRKLTETPEFGDIYSRNITRDSLSGIGKWTDGQLAYLIRTGIKPDGSYLPPYMPKLIHISDEDLKSIIAFLHSDRPWVQADKRRQPESKPSFLTKFLTNTGIIKPFPYPKAPIPGPDTTNKVKWGQYIATAQLECYTCHSKDFTKNDYFNPPNSLGFFGGGNQMTDRDGHKISSLNITMDAETGIGKWTEDDFVKAVKYGILPNGQPALRSPMLPYTNLTDNEARAIYAYLKTVPKIHNPVARKF